LLVKTEIPPSFCLKYTQHQKEITRHHPRESLLHKMSNPTAFIRIIKFHRLAPPTEIIERGSDIVFHIDFPIVIKPIDEQGMIVIESREDLELMLPFLKKMWFMIQKYLDGYEFSKVRVRNGVIESCYTKQIYELIRRLVILLTKEGVCMFTLIIATKGTTSYVVNGHLD